MDEAAKIKKAKEDWVSGLSGGPVWEINVLCSVAPAAYLVWSVLQSRYHFFSPRELLGLPIDFLLNICALLAATTIYSSSLAYLHALLLLLALFLAKRPVSSVPTSGPPRAKPKPPTSSPDVLASSLSAFPVRPYLSAYRGGMMIVTAICILAVDFHVFPRRFAKVETWGTSLMDVGVGSFVFSGGIVSAKSALRGRSETRSVSFVSRVAAALRASLPLLVLGLVRLYSVKGLDYAEHVTEYGVHWNFFFTLGFLPLAMAALQPVLDVLPETMPSHLLLGLALTLVHGLLFGIDATGLRRWAITAPRVDLLSQNREGVVSFPGYLAIFLLGVEAGSIVLPREPAAGLGRLLLVMQGSGASDKKEGRRGHVGARAQRRNTLLLLASGACVYGALVWILVSPATKAWSPMASPVSRRFANPPYVLWIATFNHLQLFLYAAVETVWFPDVHAARTPDEERREAKAATSDILAAYNAGGLSVFLVSNLGTGLVNLTVDTLGASDGKAMGILVAYMAACTAAGLGLTRAGLKLKL